EALALIHAGASLQDPVGASLQDPSDSRIHTKILAIAGNSVTTEMTYLSVELRDLKIDWQAGDKLNYRNRKIVTISQADGQYVTFVHTEQTNPEDIAKKGLQVGSIINNNKNPKCYRKVLEIKDNQVTYEEKFDAMHYLPYQDSKA
ncbi:MAG: hypothetical protein WC860_05455, partial [Candidatus Margulisiibacteriota bacterium]